MSTPFRFCLLLLLALGSPSLPAHQSAAPASAATAPSPDQVLDQLRQQLDALGKSANDPKGTQDLGDLRSQALDVQDRATQAAAGLVPQEHALQAQLAVLGPAPIRGAPTEASEVRAQRRKLDSAKADLDAQLKRARLMSQEAAQLAAQVADQRRNEFQARLAERTASPLSLAFWRDALRSLPADLRRLRGLGSDLHDAVERSWQPPNRASLMGYLLGAALLLGVGRWLLERGLLRLSRNRVPAGRLRRSGLTLAIALLTAFTTGLAAELVYLAINGGGQLDDDVARLARQLVRLAWLSAYIAGLGRALLSSSRPSWRLPGLSDTEARALRRFPWLIAVTIALLGTLELVNHTISASLPASVATRAISALIASVLLAAMLIRLGRARRAQAVAGERSPSRPLWVGMSLGALVLAAATCLVGVALGYVALAFFVALNTVWIAVAMATLYVLMRVLDDAGDLLLSPHGRSGERLQQAFDVSPARLGQALALLSGISRTVIALIAIGAVTSRLGASPEDLSSSVSGVFDGLKFGEMTLAPRDLFHAALVLLVGLLLVRVVKRWLEQQLLPNTSLDSGMRSSVVTLLGYVGGVLVFFLALATLKVSLQNIAWIASALSVGIGFGLQAIVQNFISGLILLAERPVKVGDWVSLSGVEGDIRRINVRATEIQLWDRSTMIVPNSQLITQNVRNVTQANALGRAHFKVPMPLDTDAARARDLILEALHAHPGTLENPAPFVQLDSIDAQCMTFNAFAYTRSPRDASSVRSDLQFAVLATLRAQNMPLIRPRDMVVRTVRDLADPREEAAGL